MPRVGEIAGSSELVDELEVTGPVGGGGMVTLSFVPAVVLLQPGTAAAAVSTVAIATVTG